ncbi:glycosyltransferase [Bdellovibrionota bacterium FG-1]
MPKPKASLFIATYEMPRHLALVCAALQRQSEPDFEILFCDDGSGDQTHNVIDQFKAQSSIPAYHLWQEHQGFRKCRILNQALRSAQADTFIFLDGDCIPHRHFVRDHLALQEPQRYLAGRRMELGPDLSATLTPEQIQKGFFDWPHLDLIVSALKGDSEFINRSVRVPFHSLRKILKMNHIVDLKGCNYSLPRQAIEAINGFDEQYEGYGREDTDVEFRLQNLGYRIKSLKGLALQFHVWHPRRDFTPANESRLDELKQSGRIRCSNGLTPDPVVLKP